MPVQFDLKGGLEYKETQFKNERSLDVSKDSLILFITAVVN
jgi:hypothetical protein